MKRLILSLVIAGGVLSTFNSANAQVGTWKNYLAYSVVQQIQAAGDDIFVMASNSLYQYNKLDQSIFTYDLTNGLSDVNIKNIKWCKAAKRLVVAYNNSNIDLVDVNGNVINVSSILNKTISGNKSINSIYIHGKYAYLSTGFGIVKLNVADATISETYNFGYAFNATAVSGNNIYARAADFSVVTAPLTVNLIDINNWQYTGSYDASIFNADTKDYDEYLPLVSTLSPVGPKNNLCGFLKYHNGKIYSCGGINSSEKESTVQIYNNGTWQCYSNEFKESLGHKYVGLYCLDIDPADENHLMVASQTGIYEFQNGEFVRNYSNDNVLETAATVGNNNENYVIMSGIIFENSSRLWTLNSIAPNTSLVEMNREGSTYNLTPHNLSVLKNDLGRTMDNLTSMMFDSRGYLWFVNNDWRNYSFFCYDTANNKINKYDRFINEDNTLVNCNFVRCIDEDKSGNIWICTNQGPLMLEPSQMFEENYYLTQVKVPRNDGSDYADYLLSGQDVISMAVDGAGRKWFGTSNNGVFLISEDNLTQINHFTRENSCLLSNSVEAIAIVPSTGEVFFGTTEGLCSYISDASEPNEDMDKDNVYAYPNPVTPEYTGPITVTGLSSNADVMILNSNGKEIYHGKSNGGTFVWHGYDMKGNRVASGVYMVATAKSDGSKGTVCKIAVIR